MALRKLDDQAGASWGDYLSFLAIVCSTCQDDNAEKSQQAHFHKGIGRLGFSELMHGNCAQNAKESAHQTAEMANGHGPHRGK